MEKKISLEEILWTEKKEEVIPKERLKVLIKNLKSKLKEKKEEKSAAIYCSIIKNFALSSSPLPTSTKRMAETIKEYLKRKKFTEKTEKTFFTALKYFIKEINSELNLNLDPKEIKVEIGKEWRKKAMEGVIEEIKKLSQILRPKYKAIVLLMVLGLNTKEISQLRIGDIEISYELNSIKVLNKEIKKEEIKGMEEKEVKEAILYLHSQKKRERGEFLFGKDKPLTVRAIQKTIKNACLRAGVGRITPLLIRKLPIYLN